MLLPSQVVAGTLAGILTVLSPEPLTFELGNGSVKLENPMKFQGLTLRNPRFLGSGGGGVVFAYSRDDSSSGKENDDVVVKVSWLRSAESVRNECKVLQVMEQNQVTGVEHCLGLKDYPDDTRRALIVMEPVVEDSVSSVSDTQSQLQQKTVLSLVRTMVQMLAANVVTTDVQPLISKSTGELILIDMTEAQVIKEPLTFVDVALISSFCTEVINLIPESQLEVASQALLSELSLLTERGIHLSKEALYILSSQTVWSQDTQTYLDMNLN
jgi:hypothetical protein